MLLQTATHWVRSSAQFNKYGDPNFSAPVTLAPGTNTGVRWETLTEKFINAKGDQDQSRAVVYSGTTAFEVGSYLFLGTSTASDPETVSGADQIRHVEQIPDIANKTTLYKAVL